MHADRAWHGLAILPWPGRLKIANILRIIYFISFSNLASHFCIVRCFLWQGRLSAHPIKINSKSYCKRNVKPLAFV
jgi:hypothetical protein